MFIRRSCSRLGTGSDPADAHLPCSTALPSPFTFIPQTFMVNAIGDGFPNTLVDAGVSHRTWVA